jgi:hypothetical protein
MKKLLVATALLALGSMSAFAAEIKGTIVDSMCAAKHADASEKSMACVEKCVKGGSAPALVTADGKILKLDEASKEKVMTHLGHKVTIMGTVDGDTLKIDSIKMGT